ncbi:FIP (Fungus-Induced Protein) Related [Caenorhabditis elegans]|uniref:FIP (Fungus-Induced Protein) Related n=1 Tax=Caenorhabditis elegans TaxID=6239 RepID=D5MCW7_CAEEL|nr:FIP (Fungus-Induced Protein) Related [Caenorhabditis elegans]CAE18013.1 FIP (Fungus-Induced Protein) Related [Caenorhabditis elegans]|eukprot:NP_001254357.1 Uncharacterized protein CELE_Y46G5A.36 [Caenorhabditis elegans]
MFSLISCLIALVYVFTVDAQLYRYGNGHNHRNYNSLNYSNNQHRNNYYQGYRNPYQRQAYQGYGNGYNNYYQNTYAQAQPYYGGDRYIGNGIHVDSHGNGYIGARDTGLYIFCSSRGCVGRG